LSNASECFLIEYVLVLRLKSIVLQRLTHLPDESVIILTRHTETHGLFGHVLNSNRINAYPKTFSLTYVYGSLIASVLDGRKWSNSRPGPFTARE